MHLPSIAACPFSLRCSPMLHIMFRHPLVLPIVLLILCLKFLILIFCLVFVIPASARRTSLSCHPQVFLFSLNFYIPVYMYSTWTSGIDATVVVQYMILVWQDTVPCNDIVLLYLYYAIADCIKTINIPQNCKILIYAIVKYSLIFMKIA